MADHYEVGDQLEHQTYGACTVVATETKTVGGQAIAFVALEREDNGAKVLVPLGKLASVAVRRAAADVVRLEAALVLPSDRGAKSWQAKLEGVRLLESTASSAGKARETERTFSSQTAATTAFHHAVGKKMAAGFVHLRDARAARVGDVVFHMAIPDEGPAVVFDLSPDAKTLAFAVNANDHGSIHVAEIATGQRRLVHDPVPPESKLRWPVESVLFDASGRALIYSNHSETRHLDLESGQVTVIAALNEATDAAASSEDPGWDAKRERLVVFDSHDRIRVVDASFRTLFEAIAAPRNAGSYSGVLSPSGKKLALQLRSNADESNVAEIWCVDSRALLARVRMGPGATVAAFDATETKLLVTTLHDLAEVAIESGEVQWRHPEYAGRPAPSSDGRRFVLHRYLGLAILDERRAVLPLELQELTLPCRLDGRIVWADDGSVVAVGSGVKDLLVVKV